MKRFQASQYINPAPVHGRCAFPWKE
jgi:hypothetical protein